VALTLSTSTTIDNDTSVGELSNGRIWLPAISRGVFPPKRGFEFNLKKFPAKTIIGDGQWAINRQSIGKKIGAISVAKMIGFDSPQ
jgi:hypothetical protein